MKNYILPLLLIFAFSCTNDPCEDTNCKNGGSCVNGDCECTDRYTGTECGQQKEPESITIEDLTITQHPSVADDGSSWDYDYPDLHFHMYTASTTYIESGHIDDVGPTESGLFTADFPYTIDNIYRQITIDVYDYDDFSQDDYMGGIYFQLYSGNNGYPNTLTLNPDDSDIAIELSLSYNF